jgi:uncharacterized membrane protein YsdA (DUF1294 family)
VKLMQRHRHIRHSLGFTVMAALGLSLALWWLGLAPVYAYLVSINVLALMLYGYDKRQAVVGRTRIPELVLHAAALCGGSPGALLGQGLFRHKTRKFRFQVVFVGIILFQAAAVCAYWYFVHGG